MYVAIVKDVFAGLEPARGEKAIARFDDILILKPARARLLVVVFREESRTSTPSSGYATLFMH